jgi:hypothetical protein
MASARENIPLGKRFALFFVPVMIGAVWFGCGSDPGRVELEKFYGAKITAVNEAANQLAAAKKPEEAVAAMERGFKTLKEAVPEEAALLKRYPAIKEQSAIARLQDDYLSASDKFSREVAALPNRFMADPKLIEALGRLKNRKR